MPPVQEFHVFDAFFCQGTAVVGRIGYKISLREFEQYLGRCGRIDVELIRYFSGLCLFLLPDEFKIVDLFRG